MRYNEPSNRMLLIERNCARNRRYCRLRRALTRRDDKAVFRSAFLFVHPRIRNLTIKSGGKAVPEPSTLPLLGLDLAGLSLSPRRNAT